ncbi:hypothetical protein KFL_007060040 [Klebsormidium nitens]|uniref:TraB family protein n=1 Tax=Klebsormidium nitens TaxID=105231 RepID=A0A1Y1IQP6_KLENI|nr:hypothetical protein KFL_007060040 [Klebsormidium nitens]|eukprot:GAQ90947.1 hypothetical protein KFL_007060040 [Klebsormidium nitens]
MPSLLERLGLGQQAAVGPASGAAWVRRYSMPTTPLLERETIVYMRSVRTGSEVYLIGTAHVSKASAEEVKEVIHLVRPQYVGVELDAERAEKLMSGKMYEDQGSRGLLATLRELMHAPGDIGQKVLTVAMRSMYKMLRDTGLEPGLEFKVAMEEAQKVNAEIVLLDRPAQETMARLREVLSLWDIVKLFTRRIDPNEVPPVLRDMGQITPQNIEETTEQLKTREAVRQITAFMEKLFPDVVRVMVHERDEIIFNRLRQLRGCIVAVVGMAHVDGIERLWKEYEDYGVDEVEEF